MFDLFAVFNDKRVWIGKGTIEFILDRIERANHKCMYSPINF